MVKSVSDMEALQETSYRPISVDEFDRMEEAGIIAPDERVELIDGRIVQREEMNAPHASIVHQMADALSRLRPGAVVWAQLPVVLSERSKPLPDVAIVEPRAHRYRTELPRAGDVLAIVEISDTRLAFDRGEKLRIYAKAGIPEYWIVDVDAETIEVCRDRHDLGYAKRAVAARGSSVAFEAFPEAVFSVDELLG